MSEARQLRLISAAGLMLASVLVNANPLAQGPLRIVVIEGENAVNIIQQKTAVAPVVEVRDQNNLPVAGAVVRFTIAGSKQAMFAGGSQTLTVTTNAAGRAVASAVNPLARGAVQIQVQATFQGQTAAATIAQTNVMTAAQAGQAATATASGGASGGGVGGGTIAAVAGGAAAAVGGAVLVKSKSEDDSGDGRTGIVNDPAAMAAAGTFTLQTINGVALPAIGISSPPATCPVRFDTATLTLITGPTHDGKTFGFQVTENSHTECPVGQSSTFTSSHGGKWSISGGTIHFQGQDGNMVLDDATLAGNTLTMTFQPPHIDAGREAPRVNSVWRK